MDNKIVQGVVRRFVAQASAKQKALDVLSRAEAVINDASKWGVKYKDLRKGFDSSGLETGRVWSDLFRDYLDDLTPIMSVMRDIEDELEDLSLDDAYNSVAQTAFGHVGLALKDIFSDNSRSKGRPSEAIRDVQHIKKPDGSSGMAYSLKTLDAWAKAFEDWAQASKDKMKKAISLAKKIK